MLRICPHSPIMPGAARVLAHAGAMQSYHRKVATVAPTHQASWTPKENRSGVKHL